MYERVGLKGDNKVHRGPRAGRRFNVPSGGDERYTGTGVPGGRAVTGWLILARRQAFQGCEPFDTSALTLVVCGCYTLGRLRVISARPSP